MRVQGVILGAVLGLLTLFAIGCQLHREPLGSVLKGASAPWTSISVKVEPRELIVSAPYLGGGGGMGSPSWGHCTHPYLVQMNSNCFYLSYRIMGDVHEGAVGVAAADWPAWSEDGGRTWQTGRDPLVWLDGEPDHLLSARVGDRLVWHYGYVAGVIHAPQGVTAAYGITLVDYSVRGSVHILAGQAIWTRDGGAIHGPAQIFFYTPVNLSDSWINPHGVALPDGSWLLTVAGFDAANKSDNGFYSLVVYKSVDGGRSFGYLSTIATPAQVPWGTEGPSESDMVQLANGDLLCVSRTGPGYSAGEGRATMLISRSSDGGQTWTLTNSGIQGVNPQLLVLQNGAIVLGFGRPGLQLVFSEDNGFTWKKAVKLNTYDEWTTGYLDLVEIEPNRLMAIYDLMGVSYEGKKINGIFRQTIDVQRRTESE